jgi:hypothetical protein
MVDIFEEHNLVPANTLDFTQINKAALGSVSGAVVERVENGDEDALEVYIKAKAIQEVAGNIIKAVKEQATDEAEKYGKGDSKMLGCEFIVKNGATRYSFDHDETWVELTRKIDELAKLRKAREKDMIEATKYAELTDKDGEVIPPAEITNGGGTMLTVTIPKK